MPLYSYQCPKCKAQKSELQALGSQSVPECSTCMTRMQRLVKPTSFSIGGPGVYKQGFSAPKQKQNNFGNIFKPTIKKPKGRGK